MPNSGFVWVGGNTGCLLPFLIIFNLFFGRLIFNSTRLWLGIEGILVLIFLLKIHILANRISQQFWPQGHGLASHSQSHRLHGHGLASHSQSQGQKDYKPKGKVVDIQGKIIQEEDKLE